MRWFKPNPDRGYQWWTVIIEPDTVKLGPITFCKIELLNGVTIREVHVLGRRILDNWGSVR